MKNPYEKLFKSLIKEEIKKKEERKNQAYKKKKKKKMDKKIKQFKKIANHTKRVVYLCMELCEKLTKGSSTIDKDNVVSAAWIHDIWKIKNHSFHNLSVVFKELIPSELHNKDIFGIIEQHKGVFNPQNNHSECAILRLCDKIEKFHSRRKKNQKKAKEQSEKAIDEIAKMHCFDDDSNIMTLIDFYKSYKKRKAWRKSLK